MLDLNNKKVLVLSLTTIFIIAILVLCIVYKNKQNKKDFIYDEIDNFEIQNNNKNVEKNNLNEASYVHIIGEVNNPGLVKIDENMRLSDVVEKAGGFTDEADISIVNLAYIVKDGQKIIIPNKNKSKEDELGSNGDNINNTYIFEDAGENIIEESTNVKGKVNLNTASQTELETVSGIGPSLASKIIQYRTANGKFESVEDLNKVSGIGKAKYESIKDSVMVK